MLVICPDFDVCGAACRGMCYHDTPHKPFVVEIKRHTEDYKRLPCNHPDAYCKQNGLECEPFTDDMKPRLLRHKLETENQKNYTRSS